MKLKLQRTLATDFCTIGELYADEVPLCHTLELPVRDGLPGSAIPIGLYPVANRFSHKFGRNVPHVDGIHARSDILFHWGNQPENTEGCILVGKDWVVNNPCWIGESRKAFEELYRAFTAALNAGQSVTLEVLDAAPSEPPLESLHTPTVPEANSR